MLETGRVCTEFDFKLTAELSRKIGNSRVIFTGMGSSLIFPGKQAKNRALKFNITNRVESYFASDLFQYADFSDTYVFLCSNSGKTKEVILLLDYVKSRGARCVAVTAAAASAIVNNVNLQLDDETLATLVNSSTYPFAKLAVLPVWPVMKDSNATTAWWLPNGKAARHR